MATIPIRDGLFDLDQTPPRLLGGRCAGCGRHHFPAQPACPYCGGVCERVCLAERGTLALATVVRNAPPGYRGRAPYGFGVVELPEGLRIITPLTESRLDRLQPGTPVRLVIQPLFTDDEGREVVSWAFAPVASSAAGQRP